MEAFSSVFGDLSSLTPFPNNRAVCEMVAILVFPKLAKCLISSNTLAVCVHTLWEHRPFVLDDVRHYSGLGTTMANKSLGLVQLFSYRKE